MYSVIRSNELVPSPRGITVFEGEPFGSDVSFFLVRIEPNGGPPLHKHPYSETWIIQSGAARFTAGDQEVEAGPGDIVTVGPDTPHKFVTMGSEPFVSTCIHASTRFSQTNLE